MSEPIGPADEPSFVMRSALLAKLARARFGRATIIHAPAGYGKSQLLAQWAARLAQTNVRIIPLSCEPSMRSPARFYALLSAKIGNDGERERGIALDHEQHGRNLTFAGSLLVRMARHLAEGIIVLDGYDAASSDGVDEMLAELIRSAPAGVHIVVASRSEPDLGLSALRMNGEITVFDHRDLRFTDAEIAMLLPDADADAVARLSVMTEGWPFAVHFAATHASDLDDNLCSAETLITSDKDLGDFISDAMLRNLSPDERRLLLETSFVPALDADLVEAVAEVGEGWEKLCHLRRANIVVPDASGRSFRCNPLLRAHLYREFRSRASSQIEGPLRRAVDHFCKRRDYRTAARYARTLHDVPLSIAIFIESGGILLNMHEGHGSLREAIELLPHEAFQHPRVRAAEACVLAKRGQSDVARLMLEDISIEALPEAEARLARRDINIAMLTTAAYSAAGLQTEDWERYTPLRVGSERDIAAAEGFYYNCRWGIDFNDCAMEQALVHAELSALHYAKAEALNGGGHIHIHMGRTLTELGRLSDALTALAAARASFTASGEIGALALVDIFEARCEFLSGRVSGVEAKVGPALRTLLEGEHYWEALGTAYALLADAACVRGEIAGAIKHLRDGVDIARKLNMVQMETVLRSKQMMLIAGSCGESGIDDDPLFPPTDALAPRDRAQWLERFLTLRLHAYLLAKEGETDRALAILVAATADAHAASLCCMEIECLLDQVVVSEAANDKQAGRQLLAAAVQLGARTGLVAPFVLRSKAIVSLLVQLLNAAADAGEPDPRLFIRQVISECSGQTASSSAIFSPREKSILALLAQAKCNKEIAREMNISPETVRFHLKRIYEKLGVDMGYHNRKFVREIILSAQLV